VLNASDVKTAKVDNSDKEEFSTFVLLLIFGSAISVVSWMTVYLVVVLPGPKLYNGMILGLAESTASIAFGFLLRWMSDKNASLLLTMLCALFNILYRVLGAGEGGILAMICLGISILGIGGLVNAIYIVIEMRVPPEKLGANITLVLTVSIICSGAAPNLAFLP